MIHEMKWYDIQACKHEAAHAIVAWALGEQWLHMNVSKSGSGGVYPASPFSKRNDALTALAGPVADVWYVYEIDRGTFGLPDGPNLIRLPPPGSMPDIDRYAAALGHEEWAAPGVKESAVSDVPAVIEILKKHREEWDRLVLMLVRAPLVNGFWTVTWEEWTEAIDS